MKMYKRMWWVLGLGLVFIPAWLLSLYIASLAIHSLLLDNLVVAVALGFLSYLLSRGLKVQTQQEALAAGFVWSLLLFLVELLIALANGTTGIIFGTWTTYVVYVAIALSPWLAFLPVRAR